MRKFFKKMNDDIDSYFSKNGRRNIWIFIIIVIIVMLFMTFFDNAVFNLNIPETVTTEEFMSSLEAGDIDTIYYDSTNEIMRYTLLNDVTRNMSPEERQSYSYGRDSWRQTAYIGGENFRREMLVDYNVNLKIRNFKPTLSSLWSMLFSLGLMMLMFVILVAMMQGGVSMNKRFQIVTDIETRFSDVIGQDEVLDDLRFIVQMMQGKKLDNLGAQIPKGVLLSGPPGTGKTLIARAVAGEAGVPFFSANASEFIEMYVGVGPKTVRALFRQARKHKPCIIFIDEIDAVASTRGAQGTTSEDNKTVNALLQEMDGFNKESGIFVIAATNNPDSLDPAITRAGRFDRQVVVNPPKDWKTRKKLLDLYIKDTPCNADVETLSKQIVGFTGADISAMVNEAKLVAAMVDKTALDMECFEIAIDKKLFKANRSSSKRYEHDVEVAAYHEAGHAVMNYLANRPIARASIIGSTSGVGGAVFQADKNSSQFSTKEEYRWQIKICYAGRAAEYVMFDDVTDGASSDITQATKLIYNYVCKVGMSDEYGYIDVDILKTTSAFAVPNDVIRNISIELMDEAKELMHKNRNLIEAIAKELLDKETISGTEILEIINNVNDGKAE